MPHGVLRRIEGSGGSAEIEFQRATLTCKRTLDVLIAFGVLCAVSPVLLIIAVAIRVDSRGPIIFRQQRLGFRGRVFWMLKFRSMVPNAAAIGDGLACYGVDPRVTRVGRILRASGLDELPQLVNVLRGDMSLVGPRPPVLLELGEFSDLPHVALFRFLVRPGITGLAQVTGRNELAWPEKIQLDKAYVETLAKRGMPTDLSILFRTFAVLATRRGVYDIKGKEQSLD